MKSKQAFTLIEILVIIVIIGILSTLATISLKVVVGKARDSRRMSDVASIRKALEIYKLNNEVYPPENQFIVGAALKNGEDLVLGKIPTNPKAVDGPCAINEYLYRQDNNGLSYHLNWCLGTQVQDAGPGPCIATPNHYCAPCTNGTCVNKCGGDNGCGQPCPATACNNVNNNFCNPAANYTCTCVVGATTGQPGACPAGKFCSASGTCVNNGSCGADADCGGLCRRCVSGSCTNQASGQDLKNECSDSNCFTGTCNGAGGCGVYSDNQPHNCSTSGGNTNRVCIGNIDGSCSCTPSQCGGATGKCSGVSNGCGGTCNTACSATSCCDSNAGNCIADKTDTQFCQTYNGMNLLTCGNTTGVDNCGNTKTVNCSCSSGYSCGLCETGKCGQNRTALPYVGGTSWFCAASNTTCNGLCQAGGFPSGYNALGAPMPYPSGWKLPCCSNNTCINGGAFCGCNYIGDTSTCSCAQTCFNRT